MRCIHKEKKRCWDPLSKEIRLWMTKLKFFFIYLKLKLIVTEESRDISQELTQIWICGFRNYSYKHNNVRSFYHKLKVTIYLSKHNQWTKSIY